MKYAALFRGINVGGKNIVKIAKLKKLFADLGFESVRTYIQSGNVVFEADEKPDAVAGAIHASRPPLDLRAL